MSERDRNSKVAEIICKDFAWNGQTFSEGECVALLNGKIVARANNPDDAISALRAMDPYPRRGMVVEVSPPAVDVIR